MAQAQQSGEEVGVDTLLKQRDTNRSIPELLGRCKERTKRHQYRVDVIMEKNMCVDAARGYGQVSILALEYLLLSGFAAASIYVPILKDLIAHNTNPNQTCVLKLRHIRDVPLENHALFLHYFPTSGRIPMDHPLVWACPMLVWYLNCLPEDELNAIKPHLDSLAKTPLPQLVFDFEVGGGWLLDTLTLSAISAVSLVQNTSQKEEATGIKLLSNLTAFTLFTITPALANLFALSEDGSRDDFVIGTVKLGNQIRENNGRFLKLYTKLLVQVRGQPSSIASRYTPLNLNPETQIRGTSKLGYATFEALFEDKVVIEYTQGEAQVHFFPLFILSGQAFLDPEDINAILTEEPGAKFKLSECSFLEDVIHLYVYASDLETIVANTYPGSRFGRAALAQARPTPSVDQHLKEDYRDLGEKAGAVLMHVMHGQAPTGMIKQEEKQIYQKVEFVALDISTNKFSIAYEKYGDSSSGKAIPNLSIGEVKHELLKEWKPKTPFDQGLAAEAVLRAAVAFYRKGLVHCDVDRTNLVLTEEDLSTSRQVIGARFIDGDTVTPLGQYNRCWLREGQLVPRDAPVSIAGDVCHLATVIVELLCGTAPSGYMRVTKHRNISILFSRPEEPTDFQTIIQRWGIETELFQMMRSKLDEKFGVEIEDHNQEWLCVLQRAASSIAKARSSQQEWLQDEVKPIQWSRQDGILIAYPTDKEFPRTFELAYDYYEALEERDEDFPSFRKNMRRMPAPVKSNATAIKSTGSAAAQAASVSKSSVAVGAEADEAEGSVVGGAKSVAKSIVAESSVAGSSVAESIAAGSSAAGSSVAGSSVAGVTKSGAVKSSVAAGAVVGLSSVKEVSMAAASPTPNVFVDSYSLTADNPLLQPRAMQSSRPLIPVLRVQELDESPGLRQRVPSRKLQAKTNVDSHTSSPLARRKQQQQHATSESPK
eukprot:m.142396 g.142396  ORF g.142396 m.142396 type:complete len:936 (+) comp16152_c0_seq8:277-3084(+)